MFVFLLLLLVTALCGGQGDKKLSYNAYELCHHIISKRNDKNERLVYIFEYFAERYLKYI